MATPVIHPSSSVDPSARVGPGVVIDPNVTIHRDVVVGADSYIGAGCILYEGCALGARNRLREFVVIGTSGSAESKCRVSIGDGNIIGAHCIIGLDPDNESFIAPQGPILVGDGNIFGANTLVQFPARPHSTTRIGCGCSIMSDCAIGHDVVMMDGAVLYPKSLACGDAVLSTGARVGANSVVHQRCTVGARTMVGMMVGVVKDTPPFVVTIAGKCTRLNRFLISRMEPTPSEADVAAYIAWLTGPYATAATSAVGTGPKTRAIELPPWVSDSLAAGGAGTQWFADAVTEFFQRRMGERKLAPLSRDFEAVVVGAGAVEPFETRSRL